MTDIQEIKNIFSENEENYFKVAFIGGIMTILIGGIGICMNFNDFLLTVSLIPAFVTAISAACLYNNILLCNKVMSIIKADARVH
jgi:hypothetical protein